MKVINITRDSGIPLMGHIAFGIIDRGSTLLQVRPISMCNLSCTFCSTDGGPNSKSHKTGYVVDADYLIEETNKVIEEKGRVHINIDSVGEPASYPDLVKIVKAFSQNPKVYFISMQSNGTYFTKEKIKALEEAGLNRIHISIHTTDPEQAKELMGSNDYNLNTVLETAKTIADSKIELLLAPVFLPGINEEQMPKLIQLAKEWDCRIGIQKYEEYKFSRKPKGIKKMSYYHFYKKLGEWEKEFGVKLIYKHDTLQIEKAPLLQRPIQIGERINTKVIADGWFKGQKIIAHKNRTMTVENCDAEEGDRINVKVVENKKNIYIAKKS